MQGINIKKASLDLIGFGMKAEASCINGDIIPVKRELWNEIANRLMQEKSVNLELIMERLETQKWDGAGNVAIAHNGAIDIAKHIVNTEILGL